MEATSDPFLLACYAVDLSAQQASSCTPMSPVTWDDRGKKQASCFPAGSTRGGMSGALQNSQTWPRVPRASRRVSPAMPRGRSNVRTRVDSPAPRRPARPAACSPGRCSPAGSPPARGAGRRSPGSGCTGTPPRRAGRAGPRWRPVPDGGCPRQSCGSPLIFGWPALIIRPSGTQTGYRDDGGTLFDMERRVPTVRVRRSASPRRTEESGKRPTPGRCLLHSR